MRPTTCSRGLLILTFVLGACGKAHEPGAVDGATPGDADVAADAGPDAEPATDAGPGLDAAPDTDVALPEGCCFEDAHCAAAGVCVIAGDGPGACWPALDPGRCWRDTDCGADARCEDASICGHCERCARREEPGSCRRIEACSPVTAVVQHSVYHADIAGDFCVELHATQALATEDGLAIETDFALGVRAWAYPGAADCGTYRFEPGPDAVEAIDGSGSYIRGADGTTVSVNVSLEFPDGASWAPRLWSIDDSLELLSCDG